MRAQAVLTRSGSRSQVSTSDSDAWLSVALPVTADDGYALFCDAPRIPEWLSVVRSAVVTRRDDEDRAIDVSFMARLERATIGFTCAYRYRPEDRWVAWNTAPESGLALAGVAQFGSLGTSSCLMSYRLDLAVSPSLPPWIDRSFDEHPASASLSDFRDFALRTLPGRPR